MPKWPTPRGVLITAGGMLAGSLGVMVAGEFAIVPPVFRAMAAAVAMVSIGMMMVIVLLDGWYE